MLYHENKKVIIKDKSLARYFNTINDNHEIYDIEENVNSYSIIN